MKNLPLKLFKEEKYVPVFLENIVGTQLKKLSKVDMVVTRAIEEQIRKEDAVKQANMAPGELRPDTTGKVPKRLGDVAWDLILACIP